MINFDHSGKFTHLSILVPIEAELGLAQPQLVSLEVTFRQYVQECVS